MNGDKTKYVSVGFYPAFDYQPLVDFGAIRRCGSKSIILAEEQACTLAECLPKIQESMCKGEEAPVNKCESGVFRLNTPKTHRGLARVYLGTEYICLASLDLYYLARNFMSYSNNCAVTYSFCGNCFRF